MTLALPKAGLVFSLALILFLASAWGASKARASISWADLHLTQPSAFGGSSENVTHFFESGTESCAGDGLTCYFWVEWYRYYPGLGWYLSGEASHSTDLNWQYEHASKQAGQAWPKMHINMYDDHGQLNYNYDYPPCSSWVVSRALAYDWDDTYLSYNLSNQIYYSFC